MPTTNLLSICRHKITSKASFYVGWTLCSNLTLVTSSTCRERRNQLATLCHAHPSTNRLASASWTQRAQWLCHAYGTHACTCCTSFHATLNLFSCIQTDIDTCPDFGKIYAWRLQQPTRVRIPHQKWHSPWYTSFSHTHKHASYCICFPLSLRTYTFTRIPWHTCEWAFWCWQNICKSVTQLLLVPYAQWRHSLHTLMCCMPTLKECHTNTCQPCTTLAYSHRTRPGLLLDYVLGLPPDSASHNCCIVAVDLCSKRVSLTTAVSIKDLRDAKNPHTVAKTATFLNKIVSHKGFPVAIVSDHNSCFTSNFWL